MAVTTDNSLGGTDGDPISDTTLSASAEVGTVTISDAGSRAVYDATYTVHDVVAPVEITTGHHGAAGTSGDGAATPRLVCSLPTAPWSVRLYVRIPDLQAAGNGDEEGRWLAWLGDTLGLIVRETSGGNIQLRLQGDDLSYGGDSLVTYDSFSGSSIARDQIVRMELGFDGTDLEIRTYAGHDTSSTGVYTFEGVSISGDLQVSGYRLRPEFQYPYGNSSFSQTVADYQQALMDLGYPAPEFGADGFYGSEHEGQLDDFSADYGLDHLVGTHGSGSGAGPEIVAAIDLALRLEVDGDPAPPPVHLAYLAVLDTETFVGPVTRTVALSASILADGTTVTSKSVTRTLSTSTLASASVTTSTAVPVEFPPQIMAELLVGGEWVDITGDVRTREDIQITRGRPDEASTADPGKMSLLLNNRHGRYSPRNPLSPYYGRIGRNTRMRIRVADLPAQANPHIADTVDRTVADGWGTADTGQDWQVASGASGDFSVDSGAGRIEITDDTTRSIEINDDALPADVDVTVTVEISDYVQGHIPGAVYAAVGLGGPDGTYWYNVGFRSDTGGRTRGPVSVDIERESATSAFLTDVLFVDGVSYDPGARLRVRAQAVAGQLRMRIWPEGEAEPDVWHVQAHDEVLGLGGRIELSAYGTSSAEITDPLQMGWRDLTVRAHVPTNHAIRMVGAVSSWPPRWDLSDNDVWVPVEASGILRRLGQGQGPVRSPLRRTVAASLPLAYWPLEDGGATGLATSAVDGIAPMQVRGLAFGDDDTLSGSAPLPTVDVGLHPTTRLISPDLPSRDTGAWGIIFMIHLSSDDAPSEDGQTYTLMEVTTQRSDRWRVSLGYNSTDGYGIQVDRLGDDGSDLGGGTLLVEDAGVPMTDQWIRIRLDAYQDGTSVGYDIAASGLDGGGFATEVFAFTGEVGRPSRVDARITPDLNGMGLGHLSVWGGRRSPAYQGGEHGYTGEEAGQRMARVAAVEGVPLLLQGRGATPMGSQPVDTVESILEETGEADLGVLGEQREALGLRYRGRATLYDQTPVLVLDYANGEVFEPIEPTDDDQDVVNDATAERSDGGSYQAVDEAGPMGVEAIGRYDSSVTVNVASDGQLPDQAGWRLHLGTVDEARYPTVTLNLANPRMRLLLEQIIAISEGDRIQIRNLPSWLPPGGADLIVQGYTETLNAFTWTIELTCTPASPWTVARVPPKQAVTEDFEDDTYELTITDGGDAAWQRTTAEAHGGDWSLRSGSIGGDETSDAIVDVPSGAETLEFYYKVSSELDFDYLRVLLDGVETFLRSGEIEWTPHTLDVTGVSQVTFRYSKDGSETVGEDRAWIDALVFTLADEVVEPSEPDRADTAGSELASAIGETTTTVDVVTTRGPVWVTDPAELPLDIRVGGEVMRVTSISGSSSPQTATVQRSVNGITKSHTAGADVRLAQPAVTAL